MRELGNTAVRAPRRRRTRHLSQRQPAAPCAGTYSRNAGAAGWRFPAMNAVAVIPPSQAAMHGQRMNALVPTSMAEALHLADIMASANLLPDHLRGKPGDCLLIVMQAQRWGMDAVSVAQATSVVRGKLCYEGKLVAAALYAMGAIDGRLSYEFSGSGDQRKVVVTGRPRGTGRDQTAEGTVRDWATNNDAWKRQPDDMLVYRGTRQWARRYAPEALLGVYTPDELDDQPQAPAHVTRAEIIEHGPQPYPASDFARNLPQWRAAIESGRKTADQIIALVQSKGKLSEQQIKDIRAPLHAVEGDGGERKVVPAPTDNPDFPLPEDEPQGNAHGAAGDATHAEVEG
ncbi:recombinase RecT [Xanthomonas translucens]|uniref:recombinase RecT n=1 Tax=Xanthomonas campestris pv. translucens TaxID=343 RepID=UPI00210E60C2|nr:recombinase RecT [Xanthomonas translucens]